MLHIEGKGGRERDPRSIICGYEVEVGVLPSVV